jgi:hypothetical protein
VHSGAPLHHLQQAATAKRDGAAVIDIFYGHIKIESRFRQDGLRFIGEGRALHYDGSGNLTKDTGWTPTGCEMTAPDKQTAAQVNAVIEGIQEKP